MKRLVSFSVLCLCLCHSAYSQCIPPTTPVAWSNGPVCTGNQLLLFAANYIGGAYNWTGPNGFTSTQREPIINNASLSHAGNYSVTVTVNGCTSAPGTTTVVIKPTPIAPIAASNSPVCSGDALNLTASDVAGASYTWIGQSGFTSALQNPVINTSALSDAGIYLVVATVDGCTSPAVATNVIVKPSPSVPIAGNNGPVCSGSALSLSAISTGDSYVWTGPNGFASAIQNPVINNINMADAGIYNVTASLNGCSSVAAATTVVVQPLVTTVNLSTNSPLCEGGNLNLATPLITGVTYNWSGPNGFTSTLQNPVINNVGAAAAGMYTLQVTGCNSLTNTTNVVVNPSPPAPVANNNGPLCKGQTLNLTAAIIPGASYSWAGPNGFTSLLQNPVISNTSSVHSGTYRVIATVNNCPGSPDSTAVIIIDSAKSNAGNDQTVCASNATVTLSGSISGGSGSGIWTSSGNGTFTPNNTSLITAYNLTNADKSMGNVILTLTSTNNGNCPASVSSLSVTIPQLITVDAGPDLNICASTNAVSLNGQVVSAGGGTWKSSGSGLFSPDNNTLNAIYIPSANDRATGSVTLSLSSTGNGSCNAVSDATILTINPGPVVNAGPDMTLSENESITLQPVTSGTNLKYLWTPNLYLSNDSIKNPVVKGVDDMTYTLAVTDGNGCINSDTVSVTVLRFPNIPNTFTPNNDGINDTWIIKNLDKYPDCKLQVFNRYGQVVFESRRYVKPWDGTMKGKSLPFGTYYYVIEPGNGVKPFTGYITLLK